MRLTWIATITAVALAAARPAARADDTVDKPAAEAAFLRGKELMKEGYLAEACDAFARSQRLDPQLGTQYNLALCYEQLGRTASAWALYRELMGTPDPAKQNELMAQVLQNAADLFFTFGVSLPADGYGVVKNNVVNLMDTMPNSFGWPTPGPARPEQFFKA